MYVSAPKPVCVDGLPGMPASTMLGKTEVRMVEDIEELCVEAQLHVFGHREPFRQIKVAPHEV